MTWLITSRGPWTWTQQGKGWRQQKQRLPNFCYFAITADVSCEQCTTTSVAYPGCLVWQGTCIITQLVSVWLSCLTGYLNHITTNGCSVCLVWQGTCITPSLILSCLAGYLNHMHRPENKLHIIHVPEHSRDVSSLLCEYMLLCEYWLLCEYMWHGTKVVLGVTQARVDPLWHEYNSQRQWV